MRFGLICQEYINLSRLIYALHISIYIYISITTIYYPKSKEGTKYKKFRSLLKNYTLDIRNYLLVSYQFHY